jgi:hypothetical protein
MSGVDAFWWGYRRRIRAIPILLMLPRNNTKFQPGLHHYAHLPPQSGVILGIRHHVRCHCMHFSGRTTIIHMKHVHFKPVIALATAVNLDR